jgi:glycolate oxidase
MQLYLLSLYPTAIRQFEPKKPGIAIQLFVALPYLQADHLPIVIFGHAGDGNLHPNILFDKRKREEWEKVEQLVREIFGVAFAQGGTLSGEHGVGVPKRPYFKQALGPISVEVQKRIKQALDPMNLLNPGKMFQD